MKNHPVAVLVLCLLPLPVHVVLPVDAPVLPIPASLRALLFAVAPVPVSVALLAAVAAAYNLTEQLLIYPCESFCRL
jgi:hypothetical protein